MVNTGIQFTCHPKLHSAVEVEAKTQPLHIERLSKYMLSDNYGRMGLTRRDRCGLLDRTSIGISKEHHLSCRGD